MTGPDNTQLMRWATYASVATAATLIGVKLAAFLLTGSVALLSTLIDSTLDAAASLINLLAVRHALTPADCNHRFGHAKAEPLAGLGQAAFIIGSALFLFAEAATRFLSPVAVEHSEIGIAVMVFSILLTFALVRFQKFVVARTDSVAIQADSMHYTGDVLINASVIISLSLGIWLNWTWLDPLFAIGIALYLLWSAWQVGYRSFDFLMDKELPQEDRQRIDAIILSHRGVRGYHDLRTRSSGQIGFIQLHLELDSRQTLAEAHIITTLVEEAIEAAFPHCEVIIHQDPVEHYTQLPEPMA